MNPFDPIRSLPCACLTLVALLTGGAVPAQDKPLISIIPPTLVVDCFPEEIDCGGTFYVVDIAEDGSPHPDFPEPDGSFVIITEGPHDGLNVKVQISGTASNGTDYQALPSALQLGPGFGYEFYWFPILPVDDTEAEGDETVVITLLEDDSYELSPGSDYELTLTVIDDDQPPSDFRINAGLNDSWFEPELDGSGFVITVYPDSKVMLVSWFTYELAPRTEQPDGSTAIGDDKQRWFSAQGTFDGNRAELDIYSLPEGGFGQKNPLRTVVGSMSIVFDGCNSGSVTYKMLKNSDTAPYGFGGFSGVSRIQRISTENVGLCESLQ